ncbi:MAG: CHAT domain-containing protein, partial [Acidobacteriota bacterium]
HAAGVPAAERLQEGRTLERPLSHGETHRYELQLKKGEYVRVVVEQRGIDAIVQTRDPHDQLIAEFDDEVAYRGEEDVDLVAGATGTYVVVISASPRSLASGTYSVRLAGGGSASGQERSREESRRLYTAAKRREAAASLDDARALFQQALTLAERQQPPNPRYSALITFNLAGNALERHDDRAARELYQRAIDTFERTLGTAHPYVAMGRSRLAVLYQHDGEGAKAEALVRDSLRLIEVSLGTDHLWYAQCLITQGNLRMDAKDIEEAEALDRRALGILERLGDTGSIRYAGLLNNLGEIYRRKGDNTRAEQLYLQSMAAAERLWGKDSYPVSTNLQNLGIIARERKDYPKALEYDTRALEIRERMVGPDHPDIAPLLNNLAIVYRLTGDIDRAIAAHFRALYIWERNVGSYHQGTLNTVGNLARLYASVGDIPEALAFEQRADAILERQLALNLAVGSERQKLAFARSVSERTDRTISLHLQQAPGNAGAAELAALVLLQRKGRVQDAMADVFAAARRRVADPADRALLDRLNQTTTKLATLALNPPGDMPAGERQRSVSSLEKEKEELEATLSEHSAELRAQIQPVTLAAVQQAMGEDTALVEFAIFRPFDPKAERNAEAYGPPHYAAYVVARHGTPAGFDLGPEVRIDRLIHTLRDALHDPSSRDVNAHARALGELVMQPLIASLGHATRLVISPDGCLNLIPFEALVDGRGRYLVEQYSVSYVTSGRDLLRMQIPRPAPTNPVIVADPLFGEPSGGRSARLVSVGSSIPGPGRSLTTSADLSNVYFAPLGATATEARAIKALFSDAKLLVGPRATKDELRRVNAPSILHIASHGFFLADGNEDDAPAGAGNPLLRSGLAFAGANLAGNGQSDGILTALEASGLNLWGTRLVTLSACDTGVGEIRDGEGVYGLRRAFVLAGAETLVMSLWPVSDYIAASTMMMYYSGLRAGLGRGDALRQAKLAMLKRPNRRHPYYWAGFIQSGDWAGLNGRH